MVTRRLFKKPGMLDASKTCFPGAEVGCIQPPLPRFRVYEVTHYQTSSKGQQPE